MPAYYATYIRLAILSIDDELQLFHLSLTHPNYFGSQENSYKSPLHWSKKFPAIALSEILCGISMLGAINNSAGSEASFKLVVESFETFFNIKLGNPQDIKRSILRRKIKLTEFSDMIRQVLLNYIEK